MNANIDEVLLGAIAMGSLVAAMFFFRFWQSSGDRFFMFFAISFALEGLSRILLGLTGGLGEDLPLYYLIRLVSYALILWAIWEKNRPQPARGKPPH